MTLVESHVIDKEITSIERATKTQKVKVETFKFGVKLIKTTLMKLIFFSKPQGVICDE